MGLQTFASNELMFNEEQSFTILKFFFPATSFEKNAVSGDNYRSFAQGLLIEAMDASYKMGYVEILFNNVFMKTPTSLTGVLKIIKSTIWKSAKHWFKHVSAKDDLSNAKIYEAVRVTVTRNFRSAFEIGLATGELTY